MLKVFWRIYELLLLCGFGSDVFAAFVVMQHHAATCIAFTLPRLRKGRISFKQRRLISAVSRALQTAQWRDEFCDAWWH